MRAHAQVTRPRPGRAHRSAVPAVTVLWPLAIALVIAGPLLGGGHLLLRDAVSTPRSYFTDAALGVSGAAPRAVPQDALVAALSAAVDGGVVVTAVLVATLWAAGAGAAAMAGALVPARGRRAGASDLAGRLAASTLAVWNPYVAERLLQGHWSLLAGYAALPWLVWAGVRMRRAPAAGAGATLLALAAAGLTPTGAVLGLIVALVTAALPGGRRRAARVLTVASGFAAVAAPWLITAAVASSGTASDPAGVDAFAARAEPHLGTLGSLAGLGGIWNSQAVPGSRTGIGALLGTVVVLGLVACGVRGVWRRRAHPVVAAVGVLAVAAVAIAALAATPPGLAAGRWLVEQVPGTGLFRDAQKWVALALPGYALAAALGARAAGRLLFRLLSRGPSHSALPIRVRLRAARRENRCTERDPALGPGQTGTALAAGIGAGALLIAALPSLAWGVGGALRPVQYPAGWDRVAKVLDEAPADGAVVTLPAGSYRDFSWTPGPVLDPAPRYFDADVLVPGDLPVGGTTVAGEGDRARDAQRALVEGAPPERLAAEGVRWVLVQHGTPGPLGDSSATLAQAARVYSDADLSLYRIDGPVRDLGATTAQRAWSWAGHALWVLTAAAGTGLIVAARWGRRGRG